MNKKRVVALLLALGMAGSLLAGCSNDTQNQGNDGGSDVIKNDVVNKEGLPIANEKITITAMGCKDPGAAEWNDLSLFQKAEEKTNIHFEFELAETNSYSEKKNLKLASNQYPDMFLRSQSFMTQTDEETYGSQGTFIDLTPYIEAYAPNVQKRFEEHPELKAASTSLDGKIYGLASYMETSMLNPHLAFVDQAWLDKCGITELPSTVDEFYDMLVKFKNTDCDGDGDATNQVPLTAMATKNGWDHLEWFLMPAFTGTCTGLSVDVKDGEVVYAPALPEFKEYLAFLNKLWNENLLDHDFATQTQQQFLAKGKSGKVGVANMSPTALDEGPKYVSLKPLTSEWNSTPVVRTVNPITTGSAVITDNCKYPDAAMRWLDLWYATDDEAVEGFSGNAIFAGIEGETWKYTDDSKEYYEFIDPIKSFDDINTSVSVNMYMPAFTQFMAGPTAESNPRMDMKVTGVRENQNPYRKEVYPQARMTNEEATKAGRLETDLLNYVLEMSAKFVSGEESLDNFDAYLERLNAIGLEDYLKIKTDAYDRWAKAAK